MARGSSRGRDPLLAPPGPTKQPREGSGGSPENHRTAREGKGLRRAVRRNDRYLAICGASRSLGVGAVSFWDFSLDRARESGRRSLSLSHGAGPFVRIRASSARIDGRLQPLWAICCESCNCCWLLYHALCLALQLLDEVH